MWLSQPRRDASTRCRDHRPRCGAHPLGGPVPAWKRGSRSSLGAVLRDDLPPRRLHARARVRSGTACPAGRDRLHTASAATASRRDRPIDVPDHSMHRDLCCKCEGVLRRLVARVDAVHGHDARIPHAAAMRRRTLSIDSNRRRGPRRRKPRTGRSPRFAAACANESRIVGLWRRLVFRGKLVPGFPHDAF
jgi:hypothetical protein